MCLTPNFLSKIGYSLQTEGSSFLDLVSGFRGVEETAASDFASSTHGGNLTIRGNLFGDIRYSAKMEKSMTDD